MSKNETPTGIGRNFVAATRHQLLGASAQQQGKPQPPLTWQPGGLGEPVGLPSALGVADDFHGLVTRRRSLREYAPAPLSAAELSYLLYCTQGIKKVVPDKATFRPVPSAGARHPFETFVLINRVDGIVPGLYWFDAIAHRLASFDMGTDVADRLTAACLGQEFIKSAPAVFVWVAVTARTCWRYGERSYRYFFLDAGHVCQNLYLAAETIGAGACGVAAFDDDAVDALLHLDSEQAFTVYIGAVGKRKKD